MVSNLISFDSLLFLSDNIISDNYTSLTNSFVIARLIVFLGDIGSAGLHKSGQDFF